MNANADRLHEIRYLEPPTIPPHMTVDEYRRARARRREANARGWRGHLRQVAAVAALR